MNIFIKLILLLLIYILHKTPVFQDFASKQIFDFSLYIRAVGAKKKKK